MAQQQLAATRVAAAWRLGQWEVLEDIAAPTSSHLEVLDSDECWEVRLGKMLSAVHNRSDLPVIVSGSIARAPYI